MDMNTWGQKALEWIKKYRYPILILVIGLVLMCLPVKKQTKSTSTPQPTQTAQKADMVQELSAILSQIQGVGKVQVMLTVAVGESTIYQTDEDVTNAGADSTIRKETVIISDADRNQQALISQVLPPEYRGAIIVCQGADKAEVKLAVVEAVSKATGLGSDCISVLKMK